MNVLLLNEASLMAVVAGEFVCACLQMVHLLLVAFRERRGAGWLETAHEAAVELHLCLALFFTVGGRLIGAPVLAHALEAAPAFGLLWLNLSLAALAIAAAVCCRRPVLAVDALLMGLCTPCVVCALGAGWNLVALLDIAWFLYRALSGIACDLVARSEGLSGLSVAEALMGMPAGILVVGPAGGSAFMNVRMRERLSALGLPCDLGDQSGLWERLSDLGRDLSAEASSLGVPGALGSGEERLLVDMPDASTWLFARDADRAQGCRVRIVCLDVTEAACANFELARTNCAAQEAADELRACLADVDRAAREGAYLHMRLRVHDVVGQRLSILHRYLETGRTDSASVAELERLLSSVMADLRGGAEDASAELEAIVTAFALVGVDVEVRGELPTCAAGAAFVRVIREACTNACRHGRARHVLVALDTVEEGRLARLVVSDDGNPGDGPLVEGGGIRGMRSRVAALGGTLAVERGARFTIRAEIPLKGDPR